MALSTSPTPSQLLHIISRFRASQSLPRGRFGVRFRVHPSLISIWTPSPSPSPFPSERQRNCSSRTWLSWASHGPLGGQTPEFDVCLCVGTHLIPHPNKIDKGGEDAYFVSAYNGGVIAVADGVSGWAEQNVDPSLFSRELMTAASSLLRVGVTCDPQMLLKEAHAATSSVGSATVIVAMLDRAGILKIANVGDCGLRIIREGKVVFSTSPQEQYFDCPYQLSSEVVGQTYLDAVQRHCVIWLTNTRWIQHLILPTQWRRERGVSMFPYGRKFWA